MKEQNYNKIKNLIIAYERCYVYTNDTSCHDLWELIALDDAVEELNELFNDCLIDCTYENIYKICKILINSVGAIQYE